MKKLLLSILAIGCSSAFAMTKVDFSKSSYSCNKIAILPTAVSRIYLIIAVMQQLSSMKRIMLDALSVVPEAVLL